MGVLFLFTIITLLISLGTYDLLYGTGLGLGPYKTLPDTLEQTYWGPGGKPKKTDETIRKFKVNISTEVLKDLNERLEKTRFRSTPLENTACHYGFQSDVLQKVVKYWKEEYNWPVRQIHFNKFQQFVTNIQGIDIHFVHVKPRTIPKGFEKVTLLMLHGWPGNPRELYNVIDELSEPRNAVIFELIVPSLPGFGFSEAPAKPGCGPPQMAVMINGLMDRLGVDKYYVHGGDWGSQIGSHLSLFYPERVLGLHINMCASMSMRTQLSQLIASISPKMFMGERFVEKNYPMWEKFGQKMLETGYLHIQATKPDTIGAALDDSPAGLAAWVMEKFSTGTNGNFRSRSDAGIYQGLPLDDQLDLVMTYWVGQSGMTTAARIYAEHFIESNRKAKYENYAVTVPTWCARFPNEIFYQPDWMLRHRYVNLVGSTDMPKGGHFAGIEQPKLLGDDIRLAVDTFRNIKK